MSSRQLSVVSKMSFIRRPPLGIAGNSIVAVVVFAFLLRVAFLILAGVNAPLTGDELAYQQIAENFAAGRGLFQDNNPFFPGQILYAWQAPLYPLTLGVLYTLFGNSILLAKLFGVIVSTAIVWIMYDLAVRVFRNIAGNVAANVPYLHADRNVAGNVTANVPYRVAWLAAFLVAIYPGFLTHAHLVLSETLFIFLLLLAFDFVARALDANFSRVWLWLVGAGAVWGLGTLTRGITLYFTPLFALWIVWVLWRERVSIPRVIVAAFLFVAATAIVIAPWTLRNYFQFGQVVVLETKGGVNLYLGNSSHTPNDFIRNVWKVGVREPMLEQLPGDELSRDRAAFALATNYIRAEPFTFLARMPIKFADFWGFERNLIDIANATTRGGGWNSVAKIGADLFALVVYVCVMLCGIAGFVFAPTDKWKILFSLFPLYFLFIHLVIFGDGRFHLPLIPFFALYAGWMLAMIRRVTFTLPRVTLTLFFALLLIGVWLREAWAALQVLRAG